MILSFDPAHMLAWAAVAAYLLSAVATPPLATRVQLAALALHGLSLLAGFVIEAHAGQGLRFGFAPVLSLTAWLGLSVHFAEARLVPISGLRRVFAIVGVAALLLWLAFPGEVV